MNKIKILVWLSAMALVILPPLPGNAQDCQQTFNNNDDFINVCNVNNVSRRRIRIRQNASVGVVHNINSNTGGNIIVTGPAGDVKNGSGIMTGAAAINFSSIIRTNTLNLTFQ